MPPRKPKLAQIDATKPNLVIVESPAKAKTIQKFLGKDFEVTASMWHIVDLPRSGMWIDIEHNFKPAYEVSPDKKAIVSALKKAAKQVQKVRIATDEDREWEAIGWHLCNALWLDCKTTPRIVFHEITQDAIQHAIAHPRALDEDLVDAQQARRVLDRLVGFELSPVLWKKVKPSLSAGRVQSVAVRILVDREREIANFLAEQSYKLTATFLAGKQAFPAELSERIEKKEAANKFLEHCAQATFRVAEVSQKPWVKNPSAPFTTSTLQQEASRKLGYSVSTTMQLAQRLYEAGHITYMRTDSNNLSTQAIGMIAGYVTKKFGPEYHQARNFSTKSKSAQEAHEAIRPTNPSHEIAGADDAQKKLYRLIWQKTVASQMTPAKTEKTVITIDAQHPDYQFIAKGEVITFDWFLKVYQPSGGDEDVLLPAVQVGQELAYDSIIATETWSKAPARFTEAMLVKHLEEQGIGRPSTYAPTITTIQKRGYVEKTSSEWTPTQLAVGTLQTSKISRWNITKNTGTFSNRLVPTDIGMVVTDFLVQYFGEVLDYQFTAQVEEQFDTIAEGSLKWQDMIQTFYGPFHDQILSVTDGAERASGERVLGTDPETGKTVKVRIGRYGPLVQIGEQDDEDKKYAPLRWDMRMETITLEQALESFALPRSLGERESKELVANIGRFGPYIKWGNVFASLKYPDDPYEVSRERAIELVQDKIVKDQERTLQTFVYQDKEWVVMKWRRGPFIKWNRKTIKLSKDIDGATVSLEKIGTIIDQELASKKPAKKKPTAKASTPKTSARKTTTRKKTTKKAKTTKKSAS